MLPIALSLAGNVRESIDGARWLIYRSGIDSSISMPASMLCLGRFLRWQHCSLRQSRVLEGLLHLDAVRSLEPNNDANNPHASSIEHQVGRCCLKGVGRKDNCIVAADVSSNDYISTIDKRDDAASVPRGCGRVDEKATTFRVYSGHFLPVHLDEETIRMVLRNICRGKCL